MSRLIKTQFESKLLVADVRKQQGSLGFQHQLILNVVFCRNTGQVFKRLIEMIWCNRQRLCIINHLMILRKMLIEQQFEVSQHRIASFGQQKRISRCGMALETRKSSVNKIACP